MTPPVFVVPDLAHASVGSGVRLDGAEGRHAVTVRRMGVGEIVSLVDGHGRRVQGTVSAVVDRQTLDVQVAAVSVEPVPQPVVTVVQALPKGDRGELAVEVLTEVGVDVIVPWSASACVSVWKGDRVERGLKRWQDAALAAAKQARRARFPEVTPLASTPEVVARMSDCALALVLHEESSTPIGSIEVPERGQVVIVVGPEGGITEVERAAFAQAGAVEVRLGPSVLRTSSAGIAAVSALLARSGRWAVAPVDGMGG